MTPRLRNVLFSLSLSLVTHSQGLEFSMDKPQESVYCGSVNCWSINGKTESFKSAVSLEIYDVTQMNQPVKLASLSTSEPYPCVPQSRANYIQATGNVSISHALLKIDFLDPNYCRNRLLVCQLEFVDNNGNLDMIRQTVSSEQARNCYEIAKELAGNGNDHFETERELVELRKQNEVLKTEVSRLQEIVKKSCDVTQSGCCKVPLHKTPREPVTLWGTVPALCDTKTDGGGWIVIQRRTKADVDFYRNWTDYKNGFGTPNTDFWFGNDNIHNLTAEGWTELQIDMKYNGTQYFARYSHFYVADESSNYRLSVSGYSGTAGDSLAYHDGSDFSTYDMDHDKANKNCASQWHGAWWYRQCYHVNLNGLWRSKARNGVIWEGIAYRRSLSYSEMKVRHV